MKNVMLIFGTRPEAIKMCPLVKELKKSDKLKPVVCVTGQHREMLHQVLEIFDVKPDFDLDIMKQGQDLYDITSDVLKGMRDILKKVCPDVVLVHGDTTTAEMCIRDRLRKASGRSKYPTIRRSLNGETRLRKPQSSIRQSITYGREPGELKHLTGSMPVPFCRYGLLLF